MPTAPLPTVRDWKDRVDRAAFAFRGYNITNLGRTPELWEVEAYRPILGRWLDTGSKVCQEVLGSSTDLVARVVGRLEPDLEHYGEAVALIMAVELAQLEMLSAVHHIEYGQGKLAYGYSLGELSAVAANQIIAPRQVMEVPIALAHDCAALARDVVMGILFSRTEAISESTTVRLCEEITSERQGVIGISAILSPNTYLILGQGTTLTRFKERMSAVFPKSAHLKRDPNHWPPLHTPIVRQRHIPDRASVIMEKVAHTTGQSRPLLFSLATGSPSYQQEPTREILRRWVDHPQRLWDAVTFTLKEDVRLVVHVGPAPNLIPATFNRLSENVRQQLAEMSFSGLGMRAMSNLVHRRWLANLLPTRAPLLRAPVVQHVILEDWLLDNAPR